jgi:hypothetical protein
LKGLDRHVPDRAEIRALLEKFFVGPIDDATVDRLDHQFRAVQGDPAQRGPEGSDFRGNKDRYHGQAWKELLATQPAGPTPSELAVWLAVVTPGYPPPRLYCPDPLVGTWLQVTPRPARWQLSADGTFASDDPSVRKYNHWCVQHFDTHPDFELDRLLLLDGHGGKSPKTISSIAPNQLEIVVYSTPAGVVHRLERSA